MHIYTLTVQIYTFLEKNKHLSEKSFIFARQLNQNGVEVQPRATLLTHAETSVMRASNIIFQRSVLWELLFIDKNE